MLAPELIVDVVKNRQADVHIEPLPSWWYNYETKSMTIPESIVYTIGCLGNQPTPFEDGELTERNITCHSHDGLMKVEKVETVVWSILEYDIRPGLRNTTIYRELVIDAYGDLMGRIVIKAPNQHAQPGRVLPYRPSALSKGQTNRVLYELRSLRDRLDAQLFTPLLV